MRRRKKVAVERAFVVAAVTLVGSSLTVQAGPLGGSSASLDRQVHEAREHDFTFLETAADVRRFVSHGYLTRVRGNEDFRLHNVSFPYARPEVRTFLHRLGGQYRSACGRQLVVTSLTRPESRQPHNASPRSVHPTGMAIDLRLSRSRNCRRWLERVLVSLERSGVLEATRERRPPHYHVALFPRPYARYVERITEDTGTTVASRSSEGSGEARTAAVTEAKNTVDAVTYRVGRGDSLWKIARRYGVSVRGLRQANDLSRDRIHPGQVIHVPVEAVEHQVNRGESLWDIARRYDVSVRRLKRANGLSRSRIHPDQVLHIPLETTRLASQS